MIGEIAQNDFLKGIVPTKIDADQFLYLYTVFEVHVQQILFPVCLCQIVVIVDAEGF